jgi:hypothetical protein
MHSCCCIFNFVLSGFDLNSNYFKTSFENVFENSVSRKEKGKGSSLPLWLILLAPSLPFGRKA